MTAHEGVLSGRTHRLPDGRMYRSKRIQTKPVDILVTKTVVDPRGATVRGFVFGDYTDRWPRKVYRVPLYSMIVPGASPFRVVRFGVWRNSNGKDIPVGKSTPAKPDNRRHVLRWQKKGTGRWKLAGYQRVLLHDGADDASLAWGALGCIEVFDEQEWARFNKVVRQMSGIPVERISALDAALEKDYKRPSRLRNKIDRIHWDIGDAANLRLTLEPAPMPPLIPA